MLFSLYIYKNIFTSILQNISLMLFVFILFLFLKFYFFLLVVTSITGTLVYQKRVFS